MPPFAERVLQQAIRVSPEPVRRRFLYYGGRFVSRRSPGAERVVTVLGGGRVFLPLGDPHTRELYLTGSFEPDHERWASSLLRAGDIAVDVGANIGIHAMMYAGFTGPTGHVYAFEPNQSIAAYIHRAVDLNGWAGRLTVVHAGLSDATGELAFRSTGGLATTSSFAEEPWLESIEPTRVKTYALDDFDFGGRVRLMKIDVEGWEDHVFAGGTRFFKDTPPEFLAVEFSSIRDTAPLLGTIRALGYESVEPADPVIPVHTRDSPHSGHAEAIDVLFRFGG